MKMSERLRAAAAATLLLVAGMAIGIVVDRTLLVPTADASDLTFESLAERIELSSEEAARLRILMDSLHADVMGSAARGPEALRAATEAAHARIEASLSPDARAEFRAWLEEHRQHMVRRVYDVIDEAVARER
jgi:hypothetical protein